MLASGISICRLPIVRLARSVGGNADPTALAPRGAREETFLGS